MDKEATDRDRALDGTYKHTPGACKCGHELGSHDAERARVDGATWQECHECDCACFSKPRKARK